MDRGVWQTTVRGIAKSWTQLSTNTTCFIQMSLAFPKCPFLFQDLTSHLVVIFS